MEKRLDAALGAVKTVRPAITKFYNSLSDEQKAPPLRPRRQGDGKGPSSCANPMIRQASTLSAALREVFA
jgi:LTXXQ motif family protein